jgi:hypothetical protein
MFLSQKGSFFIEINNCDGKKKKCWLEMIHFKNNANNILAFPLFKKKTIMYFKSLIYDMTKLIVFFLANKKGQNLKQLKKI